MFLWRTKQTHTYRTSMVGRSMKHVQKVFSVLSHAYSLGQRSPICLSLTESHANKQHLSKTASSLSSRWKGVAQRHILNSFSHTLFSIDVCKTLWSRMRVMFSRLTAIAERVFCASCETLTAERETESRARWDVPYAAPPVVLLWDERGPQRPRAAVIITAHLSNLSLTSPPLHLNVTPAFRTE